MFAVHQRNISSLTSSARTGETRSKRIQCALDPRRTERVNGILCTLSLSLYLPAHPLSLCLSLTLLSLPHSYNLIYSNNEQTPGWLELIDSGLDVAVVWGQ